MYRLGRICYTSLPFFQNIVPSPLSGKYTCSSVLYSTCPEKTRQYMSFPIISPSNECILQMLIVGEFWMFLHTITPISFVQQTPAERCFS